MAYVKDDPKRQLEDIWESERYLDATWDELQTRNAHVDAVDDAGETTRLEVTPDEYITLKKSGIEVTQDRKEAARRKMQSHDEPYGLVDKLCQMKPSALKAMMSEATDSRDIIAEQLMRLKKKRERMLQDMDERISDAERHLKNATMKCAIINEFLLDETCGGPPEDIQHVIDDESVPFDVSPEGPVEHIRRKHDLQLQDETWERILDHAGPVY